MPITFDTLEELKEFCQSFNLEGGKRAPGLKTAPVAPKHVKNNVEEEAEAPKKRGRKPNAEKAAAAPAPKKGRATAAEQDAPKRKGRPPSANKAAAVAKPKRDKSQTLTAKIQTAIQNFVDKNASFTANNVYEVLAKKDDTINKQSVITSVLKQMNSVYSKVSVTERPGNGPRPVKLYNAS